VRLAHTLLETDASCVAEVLKQCGFQHAADLLYLVSPASAFPATAPGGGLEFLTYDAARHERLGAIVEQTYAGSLDCPELDKVRSIDDILAGYRSVGAFDQRRWMIVRDGNRDVGCLLLAETEPAAWEVVYFGIVPAARGLGLGLTLLRRAQWMAREAGSVRLTAAVDAANKPAIDAYAAAGFVGWERRGVYLCLL
jgi:GNAT superfamily N-acetyltransferase